MKKFIFTGGLGNQLFQFYYWWSFSNDFFIDRKIFYKRHKLRELEIQRLLPDNCEVMSERSLGLLSELTILMAKVIQRLHNKKIIRRPGIIHTRFLGVNFSRKELNVQEKDILVGYFQFPKKILKNRDAIKRHFKRAYNYEAKCYALNDNVLAISARLSDDYVNSSSHNVCTPAYYKNAVKYTLENSDKRISSIHIYSDDIKKAKLVFKELHENMIFVSTKDPISSLIELSQYRYYVISNSSFSWWAAFLSDASLGDVVTPANWYSDGESDINENVYTKYL